MGYNNNLYATSDIRSVDQWREFISAGRGKNSRKCANNTEVRLIDNGVAIKLHDTDIVLIDNNNRYTLNSGGWLTVTTKDRINRYAPGGIWQERGIWYVNDKAGNKTLFYDGMVVTSDGYPVKPRKTGQYERKLAKIKKQAKAYARGYVEALQAGTIDYPNGGDCWYCLMFDKDSAGGNTDHIYEHIKQKYYVPSLLVNAGRSAGYRDDQIGLMGIGGHRVFIEPERVLYRYIVKKLQGGI